jgi:prepilin signal peptidase PulO-like enzyme (type II secretory pathway)
MVAPLQHLVACFSWKDAIWQFALGASVGSFLNVLALRTLAERNPFWGHSRCMHCERNISLIDLVPIASYMLLNGRCRFCQERISWQYPFVEVITGIMFVVLMQGFGADISMLFRPGQILEGIQYNGQAAAMVIFVSIMIALCITDFREKLLPHEITYPSMLAGILYSAYTREDGLMNCLAGIGISYIVFDFLAFYGLILYRWTNKEEPDQNEESDPDGGAPVEDGSGNQNWWQQFFSWQNESSKHNELPGQNDIAADPQTGVERSSTGAAARSTFPAPANGSSDKLTARESQTSEESQTNESQTNESQTNESQTREESQTCETTATPEVGLALESGSVAKDSREVDLITLAQSAPIKFASRVQMKQDGGNDNNHFNEEVDPLIDRIFNVKGEDAPAEDEDELSEDFEVMGGGDAVLAAVIAAWLGLNGLGFTLACGFLIGTVMGAGYLLYEMHKHHTLRPALKDIFAWCAILLTVSEGMMALLFQYTGGNWIYFFDRTPAYQVGAIAIFIGTLLGVIATGRKYSKPFPFGPALAFAAIISIFWNPFAPSGLPGR